MMLSCHLDTLVPAVQKTENNRIDEEHLGLCYLGTSLGALWRRNNVKAGNLETLFGGIDFLASNPAWESETKK